MDKLYTTARKILDDTHTHRSASEYRAVCAQDPTIPKLELFTDETEGLSSRRVHISLPNSRWNREPC